jgi:hypothetical protein
MKFQSLSRTRKIQRITAQMKRRGNIIVMAIWIQRVLLGAV